MSLRINQNVASLSTYSKLGKSTSKMEKSISKLSSGLRINTAADDAAGLAISEKMRSQVRGLNRAKLNAQDGVSMLQTAEGGLNEAESIIQRMRELAVQASNDTLTSNDRLEIQKEINQLRDAIDDISDSTEFNTKKLLNGSQTAQLTSSTSAISGMVTGSGAVGGDYKVSMTVLQAGISQMQKTQMFLDKNTSELAKGNTKLEDIAQFYDENGVFALESQQILTVTGNAQSTEVKVDRQMTLNELAASLQNAIAGSSQLGIKNSSAEVINTASSKISGLGGYIQLTSGTIGDQGNFAIAGDQAMMDALGISVTRESVNNLVGLRIQDASGNVRNVTTSSDRASGLVDGMDIVFDSTPAQVAGQGGIVDGLRFEAGDTTLNFQFNSDGNTVQNVAVTFATGCYSLDNIADTINAAIENVMPQTGCSASVVDGQIRITYKPTHADASTEIKVTGGNDTLGIMAGSYIGFADGNKLADKMVKGISQVASVASLPLNITLTDGRGNPATIQVGTSMTAAAGADLVESEQFVISANNILMNASVAARVDIVNDSIAFTSNYLGDYNDNNGSIRSYIEIATNPMLLSDHLGYKDGAKLGDGDTNYRIRVVDNSPSFQVGANAGQQMHVSISNMSSRALGIDKLDMSTSEGAQVAIEKIDIALSRVSAERSKLGAYNNRLDYTMSNLENTASNLTDAESRIRDVDMASEIISYTSSQIMQQAGTAMLAQANGMGQSVLSLLG